MRREGAAGAPSGAVHDVDDAGRNARLQGQCGEPVGGQRCQLRRLRHATIPRGDGRSDLPGQKVQRQVPGRDQPGDAEGLPDGVVERPIVRDVAGRFGVQDRRRKEAKVQDGPGHVHPAGERDRLPAVFRFEPRQLVEVLLDELGHPDQEPGSFFGGCPAPRLERAGRGGDGGIDVLGAAFGDLGDDLPRRRVDVRKVASRAGRPELAIDEIEDAFHCRGSYPAGSWSSRGA